MFSILHISPGDPAQMLLGPRATAESLARLRAELGLDRPFLAQYVTWLGKVVIGDWGRSIQLRRDVLPLVMQRFWATALLAVLATALAATGGVLTGIISAVRRRTVVDRTATLTTLAAYSMPVFWLGLLLQLLFGLKLGWLPLTGMRSTVGGGWVDVVIHAVLPSVTLAAGSAAVIARMTRSSLLEVVAQDYVRTARAKGLPERMVINKHALKNALIPVVTVVGMQFGFLLAGAILVEMVFSWPGIGLLMVNGILARDIPLVQGAILLVATMYVVVNLAVDLLYAYLDPRIRYG